MVAQLPPFSLPGKDASQMRAKPTGASASQTLANLLYNGKDAADLAKDFGIISSGLDLTAAIQAAFNLAGVAGKKTITIPDGDYYISDYIDNSTYHLNVVGQSERGVRFHRSGAGGVFREIGTMPVISANALATDVLPGDLKITLSGAATAFTAGQWAILSRASKFPTNQPNRIAEFVRIREIVGSEIRLWGAVKYAYPTSDTARLTPYAAAQGGQYSNFTIFMDKTAAPTPALFDSRFRNGIVLNWLIKPSVTNVGLNDAVGAGIHLEGCIGAEIDGYSPFDLGSATDDATGASSIGHGGFGYGVVEAGINTGLRANIYAERCRHAYTTTGSWIFPYGCPTSSKVSGVHLHAKEAGFDTHESGDGVLFQDILVSGSGRAGIQLRAKRSVVMGAVIRDTFGSAVWCYGGGALSGAQGDGCFVEGLRAFNTNFGFGDAYDGSTDWRELGAIRNQGVDNVYKDFVISECGGPAIYENAAALRGEFHSGTILNPCQLAAVNLYASMHTQGDDAPRLNDINIRSDGKVIDLVRTAQFACRPYMTNVDGVGHTGKKFSSAAGGNNRFLTGGTGAHVNSTGFRAAVAISAADELDAREFLGASVQPTPNTGTGDNLTNIINGEEGMRIVLLGVSPNTIIVKHGTGNIRLKGSVDASLVDRGRICLAFEYGGWFEQWRSF